MKPVNVFAAARGNGFMTDIAQWLVEAAGLLGYKAELVQHRLPSDDGAINLVVAPHEFYVLCGASDTEVATAARASIPVCTEQPGTPWFNLSVDLLRPSPLVLDINRHGASALAERGVDARHLRLGGVPSLRRGMTNRPIDVLYLAGATDRRGALLAGLASVLAGRRCELRMFQFSSPIVGGEPGVVFGPAKYDLLGQARIMLNLHRDDAVPAYFEWARFVEAMAAGCLVLSEPSSGHEPLQPGTHFVETADVDAALCELLADRDRCTTIASSGQHAVLEEHPLTASLAPLLAECADLRPAPVRRRSARPARRSHRPPLMPPLQPYKQLRHDLFDAFIAEQQLRRQIERTRAQLIHGDPSATIESSSPTYLASTPAVSVVVTLFNYAHLVGETLASILASEDISYEVIVIDDHSSDDSRRVAVEMLAQHDHVPSLVIGREVNGGLCAARNLGFSRARADRVMVVDADNLLLPHSLATLSSALDDHPDAAGAYGILEDFGAVPGIRSAQGWHVPWLCERNYIDAQAMLRRSAWERTGGYREAEAWAYGWEDWELWLHLASLGEHLVHVPNFVGRYRTQPTSMVTISNLANDRLLAHLRSLHPTLPWPT